MFVHNNPLYLIITVSNADLALSGLKLKQLFFSEESHGSVVGVFQTDSEKPRLN